MSKSQPVFLSYLVKQVEQALRKELDRSVRQFGLTTLQYTALSVLDRHPGMSSAQLARRSFVSPQAANEMVTALERKGLVERRADRANQRILELRLTAAGRSAFAACSEDVTALEARMLTGLKAPERRQLRALLEVCLRNVSPEDHP